MTDGLEGSGKAELLEGAVSLECGGAEGGEGGRESELNQGTALEGAGRDGGERGGQVDLG